MNKSDISQYVSGKVEPSQDKLVVLGMALDVTESWLMGFDVPAERKDGSQKAEKDFDVLYRYSMLSERDKKIISDMIDSMLSQKEKWVIPTSPQTFLWMYAGIPECLHHLFYSAYRISVLHTLLFQIHFPVFFLCPFFTPVPHNQDSE